MTHDPKKYQKLCLKLYNKIPIEKLELIIVVKEGSFWINQSRSIPVRLILPLNIIVRDVNLTVQYNCLHKGLGKLLDIIILFRLSLCERGNRTISS